MTAPTPTPTVREAGDEGIAAVLAALQSVPGLRRPGTITDRMKHAIAAALAPLIAERERAAGERAWDEGYMSGENMAHIWGHVDHWEDPPSNPYRAALAPETPEAGSAAPCPRDHAGPCFEGRPDLCASILTDAKAAALAAQRVTDCARCGHPVDLADPQPCETGGICSPE